MPITQKQLAAFQAVMREGTATRAANVLNTSQPAVTRALKQLEDATKLTLFDRRGGRLTPTPAAKALLKEVNDAFIGVERVARAAENIRRANLGFLRVGCLPAFSQGFFSRSIARFRASHPEISVAVRPLLAPALVAAIRNFETDVGVAAYDVEDLQGLIADPFTEMDEVAIMQEGHPLSRKSVIEIEDLRDEVIILLDASDPYRLRFELALREREIDIAHSVETQTSLSLCSLVSHGVGVGVVNPLTALEFVDRGLVARKLSVSFPFRTTLIRSSVGDKNLPSEKFMAALREQRDEDLDRVEAVLKA